jgi:REP element-mobilizing transposase RayT
MARKPRLHIPGGIYHVILRGNARAEVFFDPADRARFHSLLAEGSVRFGYRILAFCLMTNHVHLAVRVGCLPLSAGMHNLNFRYTRHINRHHGRVGHLFQGRYGAFLVDGDTYLLALVRYIHLNPVRAGIVFDPADYPYSSHRAYLGRTDVPFLHTEPVLRLFDPEPACARRRYARFIDSTDGDHHARTFRGGALDPRIEGSEAFVRLALARAGEAADRLVAPLDRIIEVVCRERQVCRLALSDGQRSSALTDARGRIAWLAARQAGLSMTLIAGGLGRDPSTICRLVAMIERRLPHDPPLANELAGLRNAVVQA